MESFHVDVRRQRAGKALAVGFLILSGLVIGFFRVQLVESPVYAVEASSHRTLAVPVQAARGAIVDRHGAALADNVTGYSLLLLPVPPDTAFVTLTRLAPHLDLSAEQVEALAARQRRERNRPLSISRDIPFELVVFIEERRPLFPGVLVETLPKRHYPGGSTASHLVAALEEGYDRRLTGRDGLRFIEVDEVGRLVRPLPHRLTMAPSAGETLELSIDLELHRELARLVPDGVHAGVAALDPATGEVLALYSSPGFDPHDPPPARPADRAMGTVYRAGDLWQVVTAATALRYGVVQPEAAMPLPCRGGMRYGDRYLACRDRRGHGALDLGGALHHSCDVYFYQLGLKIGLERLVTEGARLGFGAPTGIDVPGEQAAPFPPLSWLTSDPSSSVSEALGMRLAAGSAPVEVSPLRMAHFMAAVARHGGTPAPWLLAPPAEPEIPAAGPDAKLGAAAADQLRDVLRRAARPAGSGFAQLTGLDWAGKVSVPDPGTDGPVWFVGIAGPEGGGPEIVVAVVIEERGAGIDAATVARQAADVHLRRSGRRADRQ